jgi:hypothetical protein
MALASFPDFGCMVMVCSMQQDGTAGVHQLKIIRMEMFTPLLHVHAAHTVYRMGKYDSGQQF